MEIEGDQHQANQRDKMLWETELVLAITEFLAHRYQKRFFYLPLYTLTVCILKHWVDSTIFPHDSPKSQSLTKTS